MLDQQTSLTESENHTDTASFNLKRTLPIPRLQVPFPEPLPASGYRSDGFCGIGMPDARGNPSRCPSEGEAALAGFSSSGTCCSRLREGVCVGLTSPDCDFKPPASGFNIGPNMQVESSNETYWTDIFRHKETDVRSTHVKAAGFSKLRALGRGKPFALLMGCPPQYNVPKRGHVLQTVH